MSRVEQLPSKTPEIIKYCNQTWVSSMKESSHVSALIMSMHESAAVSAHLLCTQTTQLHLASCMEAHVVISARFLGYIATVDTYKKVLCLSTVWGLQLVLLSREKVARYSSWVSV